MLALLLDEPGAALVAAALRGGCLSTVNLAEVLSQFHRRGIDCAGLPALLVRAGIELVPFTTADAERAAALLPSTQSAGLSLADRACLALALTRAQPVLTADRVWARLDLDVEVRMVR